MEAMLVRAPIGVASSHPHEAGCASMTTRTEQIRASLKPHLAVFSAQHAAILNELLELAQVGERAHSLIASLGAYCSDDGAILATLSHLGRRP